MKKQIVALFVLLSCVGVFPTLANDLEEMINRSIELTAPISRYYYSQYYNEDSVIIDITNVPVNIKLGNFNKNSKVNIVDVFTKRKYGEIVKFNNKHIWKLKYTLSNDTLKIKLRSNYVFDLKLSGDTLSYSFYGNLDNLCYEVIYRLYGYPEWKLIDIKMYEERYDFFERSELFVYDCFAKLIEYLSSKNHLSDVYFHMSGITESIVGQDLLNSLVEKYNIKYFPYKTEENVILKKHRGERFNVIILNADITGDKLSIIFNEYESVYRLFRIRRKLVNAYRFVYQYSREEKKWNLIEQPQ